MPTLMRQINVVSRCGARYRAEEFKRFGLSAPHHSYILNICKNPGISQEQLAEHICVDKSNVTRQLALLEELSYIERRQSEKDRRVTLVYPTEKARAIVGEVGKIVGFWNEYITMDLNDEELSLLSGALQKIANRAKKYFEERKAAE